MGAMNTRCFKGHIAVGANAAAGAQPLGEPVVHP